MSLRLVKDVIQTKPTIEGAGMKLQRAFGFGKTKEFDPFLLLDDFRNDDPNDCRAGFPWHPHRGIETTTYVLAGGTPGQPRQPRQHDIRRRAMDDGGARYLHQKMPRGDTQGRMHGFQLWAYLSSSLKMIAPRYQDISSSWIPEVMV